MRNTETAEQRLKRLNSEIEQEGRKAQVAQDRAATLVQDYKARGINVLSTPDAADEVGSAYAKVDPHTERIKELNAERNRVMEEFASTFPGGDGHRSLGLGQLPPLALGHDELEQLRDASLRRTSLRIPGLSASAVSPGTFAPASQPGYDAGINLTQYEPTRLASYIPATATERPIIDYYRSTAGATAAASVAPGGDKPESSPTVEQVTATVVKVAHYGSVLDEVIADYPAWGDWMGSEFIAGLVHEENRQIISATGSGHDMIGLLATSGVLTYDRDASNETKLDALAAAITTLRLGAAFCAPTVIVMHPTDFLECQLLKADTAGTYLAGDPHSAPADNLWGYPVVLTSQCTQGYAIVANLPLAATIYWREFPTFEVAQPSTGLAEWKSNTTLVRAEERFVLAVQRPSAIVKVTLT